MLTYQVRRLRDHGIAPRNDPRFTRRHRPRRGTTMRIVLTVNALQYNSAWHLRNRSFPLGGGIMTGIEATLLVVAMTIVLLLGVAYLVRA